VRTQYSCAGGEELLACHSRFDIPTGIASGYLSALFGFQGFLLEVRQWHCRCTCSRSSGQVQGKSYSGHRYCAQKCASGWHFFSKFEFG
jgi:hypothetical protein